MNINRRYVSKTLLPFTLLLMSCGGSNNNSTNNPASPNGPTLDWSETLPDDVIAAADQAPTSPPTPLSQIVLDDGSTVQSVLDEFGVKPLIEGQDILPIARAPQTVPQTPQQYKELFKSQMIQWGEHLANRSLPEFQYPNEGTNMPAQNGIGYGYGVKQYKNRQLAQGACVEQIHAFDCSGMVAFDSAQGGVIARKITPIQNADLARLILIQ